MIRLRDLWKGEDSEFRGKGTEGVENSGGGVNGQLERLLNTFQWSRLKLDER